MDFVLCFFFKENWGLREIIKFILMIRKSPSVQFSFLCTLYFIVEIIKYRPGCGDVLLSLFLALLYPLTVPALSIYFAARQLFWGKDKEDELDTLKVVRLFEHLGENCLFSVSVS